MFIFCANLLSVDKFWASQTDHLSDMMMMGRKLDCWKFGERGSMLDELSYLCRKLHNEVIGMESTVQDTSENEALFAGENNAQKCALPSREYFPEENEREKTYSALSDIIGPPKSKLSKDVDDLNSDFMSNGVSTVLLKGLVFGCTEIIM